MEEKIFDLMTKMYAEMQEGFKSVRQDITEIKQDVIRIENKIDVLADHYERQDVKVEIIHRRAKIT